MKTNEIKIGQEIWYKNTWVSVNSGIVTEIKDGYVKVNGTRDTYGTEGAKIKNCYPTKQALLDGLQAERDNRVKKYYDSIQTVEDLVRFCYEHNMCAEEYTEWEAAEAARRRAKELLNLDLE